MQVTVVCYGVMREHLPDPSANTAVVDLGRGRTVTDLLTVLRVPAGRVHMVLVDGERVGTDEELREGSEVTLMPPFSGGATS